MSKNEIEQIEEDIVKLADNRELTHECAFDLGVRLGRFLEKNSLANIKLAYFEEQDNAVILRNRFGALHSKVLEKLEQLLRASIKQHITIAKYKSWSTGFEKRFTDDAFFAETIESKRNVQFVNLKSGDTQYHFFANFILTGKLCELFEKYNQPINFQIVIDDEASEGIIDIRSDKDLERLYGLSANYNCEITDSGIDGYEEFVKALDKKLLFTTIENS